MKEKRVPMRRCVGCMQSKPKTDLVRIVAEDGLPVIDRTMRADGRGVYLCRDEGCFDKAVKKKSIGRGLGIAGVSAPEYAKLKEAFIQAEVR